MHSIPEPRDFGDDFTTEHAQWMLDFYSRTLTELGHSAQAYQDVESRVGKSKFETPRFDTLNHALWMCAECRNFLRAGRLAKAYRWIGTIQGILFMNGVYSITDLKGHNRFSLPPVLPRGR